MHSFKSFDEMLKAAIEDGVLPVPASWQAKNALLNFQFNEWLEAKMKAELGTESGELLYTETGELPDYQQHLTASNFMAFLNEQEKVKQAAVLDRKQKVAARWQTKPEIESWADLFAVPNWQEYLDILCNTNPPLLVKDGDRYLPANGVSAGEIAFSFYQFKLKGKLKVEHRDEIAKALTKLLPEYQVKGSTVTKEPAQYEKKFGRHILTAIKLI